MNIIAELRKRNVFRVLAAYLVGSWIVMQVIGFVAGASNLPEWADTLVLVLVLAGLPIVGIAAWALELTPDGVKTSGTASELEPKPIGPVDYVLITAVVAVVGLFAWQQFAAPAPATIMVTEAPVSAETGPEAASIAVLAFDDLSPDGDQEYFSDGISEELLNVLVRVDGLQVASRTSAFRFKGSDADIPEIAAELNVRHVVEGSVRRAGETIRVTAQLIDSSNDRHLWSETYDRDLSTLSIFEIQDEIATAIVHALSEELNTFLPEVEVDAATTNLTAYELYHQARPIFLARTDLGEADGYLARAVELDPNYAEAWEMRAAIQLISSINNIGGLDSELGTSMVESRVLAIEYAERALALNANSSLAVTVNTFLRYPMIPETAEDRIPAANLRHAIDGYGRALEIAPHNGTALNWRGIAYRYVGFLVEAHADFTRCVELEPGYAPCSGNLVAALAALDNDEAAMEVSLAAWNRGLPMSTMEGILARLGYREAFLLQAARDYEIGAPWGDHDVLYEMYRNPAGGFEHLIPAISVWAEAEGLREFRFPAPDVMIGNYEAMPAFSLGLWEPELAGFRASDAFQPWLAGTPLPEYWRTYGFPPQCREGEAGRIECG